MSSETLQESLSAVMDNQADELELRRVLAASAEPDLRATWSRYQIARAAMHKELIEPRLDIAAAVAAALESEAAPKKAGGLWRNIGRVAVAASVTVAVLAGVRFYNQDEISTAQLAQQGTQPALAMPQAKGPVILAGYTAGEGGEPAKASTAEQQSAEWHEQRLPTYLRQHAQQAGASGAEALPYARSASVENQ
ncbi:sigma-E factor negative regulatory protein [Pseudomonas sp. LRF_L74]|uniref:sigma-E factor negative regulatory protein n=1 Tax=Pseudomonas sp. LRF_L74 TaxID=3369422 RepID=UPI003F6266B9